MDRPHASWPFQEAARVKLDRLGPEDPVIFETGFGPSGRPHLGTFAEVARTIMVQNAFGELHPELADRTRLYVFCDDMDGLRKVPANLPNRDLLQDRLAKPISRIPDPFGCCASYSDHMEKELISFLSRFGFKFELKSSAVEYAAGAFNPGLHLVLARLDQIKELILPTLQEENQETWSPIIPVCENCGKLYTTVVTGVDAAADEVGYECTGSFGEGEREVKGCGHRGRVSIKNGKVKVGWKVDWALRWIVYRVRYEMFGKDLIDSARLSGKIARLLGGVPPEGMTYEMFLDETGKKISKSVGEGLTVDAWLDYAPIESLLYFLFQNPKKQRRLFFDAIPKCVDDYLEELKKYPTLDETARMDSLAWHLQRLGRPGIAYSSRINFSLILNLISAIGAGDPVLLKEYLRRYDPGADRNPEIMSEMISRAARYFKDYIEPAKKYRAPSAEERAWLEAILQKLGAYQGDSEDELQAIVFDAAKEKGADAKAVFKAFYEVMLGQERGPRFGTFVKLVGRAKAMEMMRSRLG